MDELEKKQNETIEESAGEVVNNPENAGEDKAEAGKNVEKKNSTAKEILSWVITLLVAVVLALCITRFIIIKTEVISGSMISTLNVGDKVIGNRMAYWFSEPERGDVVFFAYPEDESKTYVKRVIGLPGDTVRITDAKVYINDVEINEPYLNEPMEPEDEQIFVVPEESYFMLGDNRNVSIDSRRWEYITYVRKDQIYAKAWLRYWPSFGTVKGADY